MDAYPLLIACGSYGTITIYHFVRGKDTTSIACHLKLVHVDTKENPHRNIPITSSLTRVIERQTFYETAEPQPLRIQPQHRQYKEYLYEGSLHSFEP